MNYYSSSRNKELTPVQAIFSLILIGGFVLYIFLAKRLRDKDIKNKKYSNTGNNPKAVSAIAQTIGATYKDSFNQVITDIEKMDCFNYFFDPKFTNVLEIENEDGSKTYIGDLEWSTRYGKKAIDGVYEDYDSLFGTSGAKSQFKQCTTLCIVYNNNFSLPHFNLVKETIEKKASEFLKKEETEDIDFEDDKEFSDSWWLASSENVLARDLFDKKVRKTFMSFIDKDYIICGHKNYIIILAGKTINPNTYKYMISEIKRIQQAFIENGKFYNINK